MLRRTACTVTVQQQTDHDGAGTGSVIMRSWGAGWCPRRREARCRRAAHRCHLRGAAKLERMRAQQARVEAGRRYRALRQQDSTVRSRRPCTGLDAKRCHGLRQPARSQGGARTPHACEVAAHGKAARPVHGWLRHVQRACLPARQRHEALLPWRVRILRSATQSQQARQRLTMRQQDTIISLQDILVCRRALRLQLRCCAGSGTKQYALSRPSRYHVCQPDCAAAPRCLGLSAAASAQLCRLAVQRVAPPRACRVQLPRVYVNAPLPVCTPWICTLSARACRCSIQSDVSAHAAPTAHASSVTMPCAAVTSVSRPTQDAHQQHKTSCAPVAGFK